MILGDFLCDICGHGVSLWPPGESQTTSLYQYFCHFLRGRTRFLTVGGKRGIRTKCLRYRAEAISIYFVVKYSTVITRIKFVLTRGELLLRSSGLMCILNKRCRDKKIVFAPEKRTSCSLTIGLLELCSSIFFWL